MRKKIYGITVFFLLQLSTLLISAQNGNQGFVKGQILDSISLKAINNANVFIKSTSYGTVSDNNGNFEIRNLRNGKDTLVVSHISYQKIEQDFVIEHGKGVELRIMLLDSVFSSKAVEIIAKKEENIINQAQRMHRIEAKEIALAPMQSISEIMEYAPGLMSNNTIGIYSSKVVISMRGMPANDQGRTLVVMDGMPLNKAESGSVNWHLFNKKNVESINIIKGPGPAKYGSGAMGGVIEIVSKKPKEKLEGNLDLSYGTLNSFNSDVQLSGLEKRKDSLQRFYWNIAANYKRSDGYIVTPEIFHTIEDSILVPSYLQEYSVRMKGGYEWGEKHALEVQSQFFDDMRGNGVQVFDTYGAFSKHKTLSNIIKYKQKLSSLQWQLICFSNLENYFRIYEYMNEGEYKLYEANAQREDMGVHLDFDYGKFEKHNISFGISGKFGAVDGSDIYYTSTDIISNAANMDIFAAYVQDEFRFWNNRFFVNFGLRYDYARFYNAHFSIEYPSYSIAFYKEYEFEDIRPEKWDALSPRISVRYVSPKENRLFFSYAKGFRAPMLDDMSRTGSRRGTFAVANPNLKAENIHAFELGGDIQIVKNLLFNLSLFHSIGEDFMYYTSTGDSVNMFFRKAPIITKSNIGKVHISGFEVETKYSFKEKIRVFANYSFTSAKIIEHRILNEAVDSNLTGNYLTDIPMHKVAAGFSWKNKFFSTSIMLKYYGETWINEWNDVDNECFFSDKFDDYLVLNLRLEKTFKERFTTAFLIENLFDKKYINSKLQESPGRLIMIQLGFIL
jgi:outer membrane receptor for ferrienterochelin and colicin